MVIHKYKYNIPFREFLKNIYFGFIAFLFIVFTVFLIPFRYDFNDKDIIIYTFLVIFVILFFGYPFYKSILFISHYIKYKKNPYITIENKYITLPFIENKKRIRISFNSIIECGESYKSSKKVKDHFIYIIGIDSESIKETTMYEYKLYKSNMNINDYKLLKNFLLRETRG